MLTDFRTLISDEQALVAGVNFSDHTIDTALNSADVSDLGEGTPLYMRCVLGDDWSGTSSMRYALVGSNDADLGSATVLVSTATIPAASLLRGAELLLPVLDPLREVDAQRRIAIHPPYRYIGAIYELTGGTGGSVTTSVTLQFTVSPRVYRASTAT